MPREFYEILNAVALIKTCNIVSFKLIKKQKQMKQIKIISALLLLVFMGCSDANEMLDKYTEGGPMLYSGKINELTTQSGYYRVKVNVFPAPDVNRDHCLLSWNVVGDRRDSLIMYYDEADYNDSLECYSTIIDLSTDSIQGSLWVTAQNVDVYGSKSLTTESGAFVYGTIYETVLLNDGVHFNDDRNTIVFDRKVGSVGNYVSYEKSDNTITEEIFFQGDTLAMDNPKVGGVVKYKTRYLIKEADIDTLDVTYYSEEMIPSP